jgi:hypothetical protein
MWSGIFWFFILFPLSKLLFYLPPSSFPLASLPLGPLGCGGGPSRSVRAGSTTGRRLTVTTVLKLKATRKRKRFNMILQTFKNRNVILRAHILDYVRCPDTKKVPLRAYLKIVQYVHVIECLREPQLYTIFLKLVFVLSLVWVRLRMRCEGSWRFRC